MNDTTDRKQARQNSEFKITEKGIKV